MPGGWTVLVCVALWGCSGGETAKCDCEPCVDLNMLDKLLDMDTAGMNNSRILLAASSFKPIRDKRKLHACVLMEVLGFFQNLLKRTSEKVNLLHFLKRMEGCVHQNPTFCSALKREVGLHQQGSKGLALLQISQLNQASSQLHDEDYQKKAMVELQGLKGYITGSGFRRYQLIRKP